MRYVIESPSLIAAGVISLRRNEIPENDAADVVAGHAYPSALASALVGGPPKISGFPSPALIA